MHLRSLQLTNYRNFHRLHLVLDDGPTVICAPNAQGKTNLLEAIELLATTKAVRAGSDRELIHWAALEGAANGSEPLGAFARVAASVGHERGEIHADIVVRAAEPADEGSPPLVTKIFRLNGLPRRAAEFVGAINVVAFSPEDVNLVAGAPAGRRRYLDVTNAQMSGRYLRTLQRYNKVLLQRNQLLRQARERGYADPSLGVWDAELAQTGAFLLQERARFLSALAERADWWFRELAGWGQRLEIRYKPGLAEMFAEPLAPGCEGPDARLGQIQDAFVRAIERVAPRERAAAISLVGPHRDDFGILVDSVDLSVFGSRGQQRIAVLSLKLAELDVLEARVGSRPILLLDDVLSELDDERQAAVLRVAGSGRQTLLTVTRLEKARIEDLPNAAVVELRDGVVAGHGRDENHAAG